MAARAPWTRWGAGSRPYGWTAPGGGAGAPPPSTPPPGTYDPYLDAAYGAAQRGYGDEQGDVATQRSRLTSDYGIRQGQLQQQQGYNVADHQRALDMLQRQYTILKGNQDQQGAQYGLMDGGAAAQSLAKRAANQAIDQQPIDTNFNRATTANTQAQAELALQMAPPDAGNPLGGRSFQDLTTQDTRAGRELTQFGIDTAASKGYQAAGMGWDPGPQAQPPAPAPPAPPFHTQPGNGGSWHIYPGGRRVFVRR